MLFIIRHGQTDWNARFKLQGKSDIPLNDTGREMAAKAGEDNTIKFDYCFCSPLSRARETADIFLKNQDVEIIEDDRLMEVGFGEYEGVENSFQKPELNVNAFFKAPTEYVADKDAESFEKLYERTGEFIREKIAPLVDITDRSSVRKSDEPNVLIVGHGAMNCSIINQIKNIPLENFWDEMTGNCELKRIL